MQKLWGFEFACWIYPGDGPESPAAPESPPQMTGVSGPWFSLPFDPAVGRYCIGVRRYPGDGPESPAHRSLRPQVFSARLRLCGAVLDRGPEDPRRGFGVSAPRDRNIRPSPMTRSTRSLAGMSGPGRSLRSLTPESPAWTGSNG